MKEQTDTAEAQKKLSSLQTEFDQLVDKSRKLETEKENLQNAQIVLQDKIKELEMDNKFISVNLAQAKLDIEMQTKAR